MLSIVLLSLVSCVCDDVCRVSEIAGRHNVSLGCWEDGLYRSKASIMERSELNSAGDVFSYVWNNVWNQGTGRRAYQLANARFKVSHSVSLPNFNTVAVEIHKRSRRYLLQKPSYSQFCLTFRCHGNQGQLGVNIRDTVKLADPDSQTLKPNRKWIG